MKRIFIFLIASLLLGNINIFGQDASEIEVQIDSLNALKAKMEGSSRIDKMESLLKYQMERKSPGTSLLLSLVIAGGGQYYNGDFGRVTLFLLGGITAVGMIVYNGGYVLKECLDALYPYVEQIVISEGCVQYYQELGGTTSTDGTNEILEAYDDPMGKITVVHGVYKEKTEQANAYMPHLKDNITHLWNVDSDEIYKDEDIKVIKGFLKEGYTSMGFKSKTFFGGFKHIIGGFEARAA